MFSETDYSILDQEIHIWILSLSNQIISYEDLKRTLSYSELKKIDEFNVISEKERYLYYRGIIRIILSNYTNLKPEKIILNVNDKGKPFIKNSDLRFSISHKNDLAIIAIGMNDEIGVAIEDLRNEIDYFLLIKEYFNQDEREEFNNLRPLNQRELFFRIWTMKEAVSKLFNHDLRNYYQKFNINFSKNEILGIDLKKIVLKNNIWFKNKILLDNYVYSIVSTSINKKIRYFNL